MGQRASPESWPPFINPLTGTARKCLSCLGWRRESGAAGCFSCLACAAENLVNNSDLVTAELSRGAGPERRTTEPPKSARCNCDFTCARLRFCADEYVHMSSAERGLVCTEEQLPVLGCLCRLLWQSSPAACGGQCDNGAAATGSPLWPSGVDTLLPALFLASPPDSASISSCARRV